MSLLLPSNCSCYNLVLPQLDVQTSRNADECTIKRLTLDTRTGAASVLARSGIFVHGGLTVPLDLSQVTSLNLQQELIMHFARERKDSNSFENLSQWISKEMFFLDLLSRRWERVPTTPEIDTRGNITEGLKERLFHSMCYCHESIYVFGGLTVSPQYDYEFMATNELWRLDLHTKVWSLVSCDPSVTRRFNNQIHVLYEFDNEKDTKLIVVGGLNNMDQPVDSVDVYNLSTNRWESHDVWNGEQDLHDITINIEGKSQSLISEKNLSLLIEDNEAKLPTLAFYSSSSGDTNAKNNESQKYDKEQNPLFALPLIPETEGVRMHSNESNTTETSKSRLHIAYNLQYPTGDKFGYNIVVSGFHPNLQSQNFHCFLYNITSGKWTRLNLSCDDLHSSKHRFWKLFLWESHHKAILLGTKNDDGSLPSVQRFDRLLSFGLHITNLFHAAQNENKGSRPTMPSRKTQGNSFLSETEQFENYSKYVSPPSEITSIRSVFPSYSMVLGKDSLEVYNKILADFEFITEEGEYVAVPSFLLRKRWGRYFDKLLANGYVQVIAEKNLCDVQMNVAKFSSAVTFQSGNSPHTSSISSVQRDDKKPTSQGSLDGVFNRHRPSGQSLLSSTPQIERKSACLFFGLPEKTSEIPTDLSLAPQPPSTSVLAPMDEISEQSSTRRDSVAASGVTSSSGGMVFRVPFRPSGESSKKSTPPPISLDPNEVTEPLKIHGSNRRKASASSFSLASNEDNLRGNFPQSRKISQSLGNENLLNSSYGFTSPLGSRKDSYASTCSSISHVSSSSDRMGESIYRSTSSDDALNLNITLPPLQPVPSDPLPPLPSYPPADFNLSKRLSDHFNFDARYRASTSPLSSRRSSLHHDISQHLSQESIYPSRIDEIFVGDPLQKIDSDMDGITTPQNERSSFASVPDSINNQQTSSDIDFEPLLIPRSLYMPWPSETVKAFAEYFYTGQIDGKWPLSPVAVGLLNMAKVYEVPLLFDLMLEVFYSIIGKKEESLFVICSSMKAGFLNKVSSLFEDDSNAITEYLDSHKNYQEFKSIEKSLRSIDDGYFDIENLRKASAAISVSTISSSATNDISDKLTFAESPSTSSFVPTMMTGSPRDSINSISSIQYPSSITISTGKKSSISHIQQRINTNPKHKSSLSKEVAKHEEELTVSRSPSPSHLPQISTTEMHAIDNELDQVDDLLEQEVLRKGNSMDSTSSSDSDDLGVGLGIPSRSKIEKSLKERALELEDSIDPLSRANSESGFSHSKKPFPSGKLKTEHSFHNQKVATLDSLASPNSLPPVDYVMELIYEAAVLVGDVKLMVRCMDCLHISKSLKGNKKKLVQDMSNIDETLSKNKRVQPRSASKTDTQDSLVYPRPFEKITKSMSNLTLSSVRSKTSK